MNKIFSNLLEQLYKIFQEKKLTLSAAESCTGGGFSFVITKSICSSLLERSFVTYSLQAKEEILNVKTSTLDLYGAVSRKTAIEMAEGALNNSRAQVSIAITGVAGEDTESKIGFVFIACAQIGKQTTVLHKKIKGTKEKFINQCILEALKFLLKNVQ